MDLGLVYEVLGQDGHVHVVMTMTTAACPLGESITEEVRAAIRQHVRGVTSVTVDLVWQPPWQPSMMSATAREQLGWRSSRPSRRARRRRRCGRVSVRACPSWRSACWRSLGALARWPGPTGMGARGPRASRGLSRPPDGGRVPRHGHRPRARCRAGAPLGLRRPARQRSGRARADGGRAGRRLADAARQRRHGARVPRDPPAPGGALHRDHGARRRRVVDRPGPLARRRADASRRLLVGGLPRAHDRRRATRAHAPPAPRHAPSRRLRARGDRAARRAGVDAVRARGRHARDRRGVDRAGPVARPVRHRTAHGSDVRVAAIHRGRTAFWLCLARCRRDC